MEIERYGDQGVFWMLGSIKGAEPRDLSSLAIPSGRYRITREINNAVCRLSRLPETSGPVANPLLFSVASLAGLGISIEDLCKLCDFDYRDAPMIGGCRVVFSRPLKVEETYEVQAELLSLERKIGKRTGVMDLLKFNVILVETGGEVACTITYTWVLPRGKSNADGR
ncbi:MAG: hypothetical protein D6763_04070 [Alphaproteobacteria bacterium]|nr:MAG: hypothetical protein D6763_04070 [Alphaproteobacteria bacterium]